MKKVLFIENDSSLGEILKDVIEQGVTGYEVHTVSMDFVARNFYPYNEYDIIIVDCFELYRHHSLDILNKIHKPVILLENSKNPTFQCPYPEHYTQLIKPFSLDALDKALSNF